MWGLPTVPIAGLNNDFAFIPARDEAEYNATSKQHVEFVKQWLQWGDEHIEFLRNAAPDE